MLVIPDIKLKKKRKKKNKTTVCFKIFNVFRSMCCEVIWNLSFFCQNCTAPIYCNVIKNSYCEFLSEFAFSLPGISMPPLCSRYPLACVSLAVLSLCLALLTACPKAVGCARWLSLPLRGGAAARHRTFFCTDPSPLACAVFTLGGAQSVASGEVRFSFTGACCPAGAIPVPPQRPCRQRS